ncbi:hypothetical protein [Rhizobium leguminosarum]|uniref:hypothetical protein n=1 Tax=Rhizobium leguminosarum TaxID=384 RepID=UPI001C90A2DC|nr:hypothetical protein [Rhizobium leguminosarum]MBY2985658.1 hypothetical protein [Rhizobium leguminosarum]
MKISSTHTAPGVGQKVFTMSVDTITCKIGMKYGSITISGPATLYDSLDLEGCVEIQHLPSSLTIIGSLILIGTRIRELPNNLVVFGNVDLEGCDSLEKIGSGILIDGDLNLEHCTSLRDVPDDLQVKGSIFR